ncbi:MAG: hypothetical protein A2170_12005 [Deltaproteobacteria bacterium RBG_13_53_10]|nr:MAG: hypothetical protein A2170_12005 [Deltaproteobacteria bacterium RBG_13_53_10]
MIGVLKRKNLGFSRNLHVLFRSVGLTLLAVTTVFTLMAAKAAHPQEKITIGEVEEVILLPWQVRMPARIDTGASQSSIDAQDLKIEDNMAEFRLRKRHGGLRLRLPVIEWQDVLSSEARDRRPVVEMEFCLGPRRIRTKVSLNDRSMVKYPLIIGRDVLRNNFVVDCTQSNCSPPQCPEIPSK